MIVADTESSAVLVAARSGTNPVRTDGIATAGYSF
jgi:hypothetical protein